MTQVTPPPATGDQHDHGREPFIVHGRPIEDRSFEAVETAVGAAVGFAIGAAVGGPVGAVVGAVVGGTAGLATGEVVERAEGLAATTTDAEEPQEPVAR